MSEKIKDTQYGLADFFYEQCCGSHSGHMAMLPNNPTIYSLMKALTSRHDNCHAASKSEFAEVLKAIAEELSSHD